MRLGVFKNHISPTCFLACRRKPQAKRAKLAAAAPFATVERDELASEEDMECDGWTSEYEYHSESDDGVGDEVEDPAHARKVGTSNAGATWGSALRENVNINEHYCSLGIHI